MTHLVESVSCLDAHFVFQEFWTVLLVLRESDIEMYKVESYYGLRLRTWFFWDGGMGKGKEVTRHHALRWSNENRRKQGEIA